MFLCLATEINDQFLEQQMYVKFCVKLGKNATSAMLSKAYGGEPTEKVKCICRA
jgi:hypothetical protein